MAVLEEQPIETPTRAAAVTLLLKSYNWLWRRDLGSVFRIVCVPRDNAKSNFGNKNIEMSLVAFFMLSLGFMHTNVD